MGRGGCGAPGTTPGPGGLRAGWGSCASIVALASRLVLHGSQPSLYPVPGGIPKRKEAKGGFGAHPWLRIPRNPGPLKAFARASSVLSPLRKSSLAPEGKHGARLWFGGTHSCRGESHACARRLLPSPGETRQRTSASLFPPPIPNLLVVT